MIIDLHTQIWSSPEQLGSQLAEGLRRQQAQQWGQFDGSTAAHEQAMSCVDAAAILGFRSERLGALVPNEFIAEFVAAAPDRRIGIAGIDPMSEDATAQMDAAIGLGLSGITVSPACQGFHPLHSDAMMVYERCVEAALPIFVTLDGPFAPGVELEYARPGHWDEVARTFPELRVVIGQLGHPWIDETLFLLGKHEHIFADLSGVASRPWQLYNALLNAMSFGVMDRLLFGSGFPRESPAKAIESLYLVNQFSHGTQFPSIPRTQIRQIIERDSLDCLGIEALVTPRVTASTEDEVAEPAWSRSTQDK